MCGVPVARLLERLVSLVLVEYSQFTVQDYDGAHRALKLGGEQGPYVRVAGGRGGLWDDVGYEWYAGM